MNRKLFLISFVAIVGLFFSPILFFHSGAISQNQLIVDNSLGTIPTSLEPYCGTYNCVLPVNNLVGYWKFDTGSGSTTGDNSGNGNTGTLVNSPTWLTGSNCMFGDCLNFTAPSQLVSLSSLTSFEVQSFTISAWIKFTTFSGNSSTGIDIMFIAGGGNTGGYRIVILGSKVTYLQVYVGGAEQSIGYTNSLTTGVWYLFTGTYGGGIMTLYENGVQEVQKTGISGSITYTTGGAIAEFSGTTGTPLSTIDDIRFYTTALTATQISDLYNYYPSGNGYYSTSSTAFIYTQSKNALTKLTQYSVDNGVNNTIPDYNSATLLEYNQPMNTQHHWIFYSGSVTSLSYLNIAGVVFCLLVIIGLIAIDKLVKPKRIIFLFLAVTFGILTFAYWMGQRPSIGVSNDIFVVAYLFIGFLTPAMLLMWRALKRY